MIKKSNTILIFLILINFLTEAQTITDSSRIVRILSFNILHGATTRGDFNIDVIADVINNSNPDFVALQEVDYKTNRAKKYDLVTELGWRTKMSPLFGRAMYFDGGEYGEGILSKSTFLESRNVILPHSKGNEPRAALEIITVLPSGDTIAFIGTHLDHLKDDSDRIKQVNKINEVFSLNKYPTLLVGDLNDTPMSTSIEILEEIWTPSYNRNNPLPTFPSDDPKIKIDYVMYFPAKKWRVLSTEVIQDTIASDHCAYLVVIELLN